MFRIPDETTNDKKKYNIEIQTHNLHTSIDNDLVEVRQLIFIRGDKNFSQSTIIFQR